MGLLEAGEDGRTDTGLEEEDHHEGEGVGGESVVAGVVDITEAGPLLDSHHQGPHSPVQLGVAVEEVSVPHTKQLLSTTFLKHFPLSHLLMLLTLRST